MDKIQLIIGYGTGRCGTSSLAHLLNLQPDCDIRHEAEGLHWWPILTDYLKIRDELKERLKHNKVVGNIGYMWLQYVSRIVEEFSDVNLIHIWRKEEEVVESFWKRYQDRLNADFVKVGKDSLKEMQKEHNGLVATPIRYNSKLKEAPKKGKSIFKYAKSSLKIM